MVVSEVVVVLGDGIDLEWSGFWWGLFERHRFERAGIFEIGREAAAQVRVTKMFHLMFSVRRKRFDLVLLGCVTSFQKLKL